MTILRVPKRNSKFTAIDNESIKDPKLSLQAKGLIAYIMSLPDTWGICMKEIATHASNSIDSTRRAFSDLESNGYAISIQKFDGLRGRSLWVVSETKDGLKKYLDDNPDIAKEYAEKGKHDIGHIPTESTEACPF